MLLQEEMLILQWLSQYGVLTRKQLIRMLQKETATVERIIKSMKKRMMVAEISGGYYIGLDSYCRPDQRTILAIWVLLKFIKDVDPMAHYPASYPSQIFFLKENTGYEIVVLYEGEGSSLKLLQPDEELKYIIVVPHISMVQSLKLPKAQCLIATVDYNGEDEPEITFYTEEFIDEKR